MRKRKRSSKKEKSAMSLSLYGNLFFVIVELFMAIFTGSQAVLLDSVYDGIEFFMMLPSILMIPLLYKPVTEKRPFGYMQLETIFLVIKGITMTTVTVGLIANNINLILHGGRVISFGTVAYFELFACVLGVVVYLSLKRKNHHLNSPTIEVEMIGWKIDSVLSLGMTLAFFLPIWIPFPEFQAMVPYLDPMITVVLSMIMLPAPVKTVITGTRDLLLLPPEEETVQEIQETVEPILAELDGMKPYYNIVRTGRKIWVSVYAVFDRDTISLRHIDSVQARCILALAEKHSDFYFELLPEFLETADKKNNLQAQAEPSATV